MNTQRQIHISQNTKYAWIDAANRIVSFRQIRDASCYSAVEADFWNHIMSLVNVGYRLQ